MSNLLQFIKYCVTGVLNTGVSYVIYAALIWCGVPAGLSMAVGYGGGMVTSYFVNLRWTFAKGRLHWRYLWRFIAANALVLLLSEESLWQIRQHVTSYPYAAQALNLVPITLLGYLVNKWFVFGASHAYRE